MWNKKETEQVAVMLHRTQLSMFRSSVGQVVSLPFEASLVQDLEVIDAAAFAKLLTTFIQQQKLQKASIVLLLDSSIYFSQKAASIDPDLELKSKLESIDREKEASKEGVKSTVNSELENQKKLFAQSVPFANVFSTIVSVGREKFFLAMNRDFYEPVIKAFSEKELVVTSILPVTVISGILGTAGFTPEAATTLLNSVEKYKTHNLLEGSLKSEAPIVTTALPSDPSDKKRLVLMSLVFVVLIGVLVAVILWSRQRDQQLLQQSAPPPVVEAPTVAPSATLTVATDSADPAEQVSTQSAALNPEVLSVAVLNASGQATGAARLVGQLTEFGFTSVSVTDSTTVTGPMTVTLNTTVPIEAQLVLERQLEEWGYQARFVEDPDQSESILITVPSQ